MVNGISAANTTGTTVRWAIVAPASTSLSLRAVTGHVSSITTGAANNTGSVVLFLGAVILAVADLTAVLASLVLVVTEGTVQGSKLTELVTLELVLTFGNRSSLQKKKKK